MATRSGGAGGSGGGGGDGIGKGKGNSGGGSRQNQQRKTTQSDSTRNQKHHQRQNQNRMHPQQRNDPTQQRGIGQQQHAPQRSNNHHNYNNNRNLISHGTTPQKKSPQPIPISGVPYGFLPAFLPGSASLTEQLDQRVMIVLRDGRHLVGILRSFDQFSNMVLEDTSERRILHAKATTHTSEDNQQQISGTGTDGEKAVICYYTDVKLGLYLVRGDSMVLLGEVDDDEEEENDEEDGTGTTDPSDVSDECSMTPASAVGLSGSGLLMGGKINLRKKEMKTRMKRVSLVEFEKLEKKIEEEGAKVDALAWEFDMDLAV